MVYRNKGIFDDEFDGDWFVGGGWTVGGVFRLWLLLKLKIENKEVIREIIDFIK